MKSFTDFSSQIGLKLLNGLFSICLVSLLIACGSTSEANTAQELRELERIEDLVQSREFEIENQWANPLAGQNINLSGHVNSIRFEGDSVEVFLPYFGVRHSGGGIGTEGGIKYDGLLENFNVEQKSEKLELNFEAHQGSEQLEFYITLYPNGNTDTRVTSSQRSSISFRGKLQELPKESD